MGKPRLIILVRHAQSEGNKDRQIHQVIPDHRVKLTEEGWRQAEEAGRRLRRTLKPDDTLQIFTSPCRRTRETTEGILSTLTSHSLDENDEPSPFTREKITVFEEPRLREQDFGNFQPCSAEMERMWRERADYGHFFYRIPNGESAADAYDRVSGFNESLWRQFGDKDFPSVVVLVTHGLMSRIFLMKWYHWSVEYFEDLRNVNHCEFVLMRQNLESGKFELESQLRTWSELKRQRAHERAEEARRNPTRRNTLSAFLSDAQPEVQKTSPSMPARKWGGCVDGCDHHHHQTTSREERNAKQDLPLPLAADAKKPDQNEAEDHPIASQEPFAQPTAKAEVDGATDGSRHHQHTISTEYPKSKLLARSTPSYTTEPSGSGAATPHEMPSDDENGYFPQAPPTSAAESTMPEGRRMLASAIRRPPERKPTPEDVERWVNESGMGRGRRADALGDEPDPDEQAAGKDESADIEAAEKEDKSLRGSVY